MLKVPLNPSFNANQVVSALTHLSASHLIISLETNPPRKPPRSNIPLLKQLVPSLETTCESELVPSLKGVIIVDNTHGRIDASSFKAFSMFPDALEDGSGRPELSEDGLSTDDVANIQFTSG